MDDDPEQQTITDALNRIDSYSALGRNSLAQSRLIDAELARAGLRDTPFQRGRLLSRLMREEVRQQFEEREAHPEGRDVAEWSILYLRVHDGLSLQEIAERLNMPVRSVGRYYGRAKEQLLDRLYTTEEEATGAGLHCPACGARLVGPSPQPSAPHVCTICSAEIELSLLGPEILRIIMKPGPSSGPRSLGGGEGERNP